MRPRFNNIYKIKMKNLAFAIIALFVIPFTLPAQTDSTGAVVTDSADTKKAAEAEAPEMIAPGITFTAVQKGENGIDLKAVLKAKVKGQFYNLYRLRVKFFAVSGDAETELGSVITDGTGKALLNVKNDTLPADAEGNIHFKAVFAGNKAMDPAEEVVAFKKAKLQITPVKQDSALSVQVKFTELSGSTETPVKDATVGVYVKRLFLPQKIGEVTTDENGEGVIEFPNGIPGDAKGNLTILGRIDENEMYGNLEASSVQQWGVPVSDKSVEQPRALWSSHPPLWMLITFIVLMVAVWGHYIVIVFELFRLRKEEPHLANHATNS